MAQDKWLDGSVDRVVMSAWDTPAAASVRGATFSTRQNAGSYLTWQQPRTRDPPPFLLILRWLYLKPVKLIVFESKIKSNTNCHLLSSSTPRSHTHARCPSPFLLIGSPSCSSAFATLDWLARPAPPVSSRAETSCLGQ